MRAMRANAAQERLFKKKFLLGFGVFSGLILAFVAVGAALVWGFDCEHCSLTKPRVHLMWCRDTWHATQRVTPGAYL